MSIRSGARISPLPNRLTDLLAGSTATSFGGGASLGWKWPPNDVLPFSGEILRTTVVVPAAVPPALEFAWTVNADAVAVKADPELGRVLDIALLVSPGFWMV